MTELLIIIVCLLANAVLAAVEMAFVSVSKAHLRKLVRGGNSAALTALNLRANPERTLSVLQVGITLVGVLAAAVGGAGAEETLSPWLQSRMGFSENTAEAFAVLGIAVPYALVSVVVGELVPKSLALRSPDKVILWGAPGLKHLDRVFLPAVVLLEKSTHFLLRVFFPKTKKGPATIPSDAQNTAGESVDIEELSVEHKQYVMNLVNLSKMRMRDILVPWKHVVKIDANQGVDEVAAVVLASGHTRLPVTRDGHLMGILNTKEFFALDSLGLTNWQSLVRPALVCSISDSVLRVLRLMQHQHSHLAVIRLGPNLEGMVTMEDIFEEIVGDIFDEDDDGAVIRKIFGGAMTSARRNVS